MPTIAGRRRARIVIHRVKALAILDRETHENIPITTVPRVLLDVAPTTTQDELARACHEAWVRHRVGPAQITNIDHNGDNVDCRWPELDLTIELLSYRFHGSRRAFEQDIARRRRSNHIAYTYGDVVERGSRTAADVRRLLGRRGEG